MVQCFVVPQSYRSFLPRIAQIPKTQFLQKIFVIFISNTPTMKHLLLLLFTTACFAQNAKVRVYRLVNENSDGPCSVSSYVEWQERGLISYVTAESNDITFVQNLLKLKKDARKWKKTNYFCFPGAIGGSMIHNMFVIESGFKKDTVFTYYGNDRIILPEKHVAYLDKKEVLRKMLPKNIKDFFEHDFLSQLRSLSFSEKNDSINSDEVLYKDKRVIDIFNKDFDTRPGTFRKIKEIPLDNYSEKTYTSNNDTVYQYHKQVKITITNPDSGWDIDGFKPGDTEEKVIAKYPLSTSIQKYYHIRHEDIVRNYFYWVLLKDKKGSITYYIKDHIIDKIEISLD
jgi:hypothetical protein